VPRVYSELFPRLHLDASGTTELPGLELIADSLGGILAAYTDHTGLCVIPHDPPKYFRCYPRGEDPGLYDLVDVHVERNGDEICPKQDLAFPLLPGDVVTIGLLSC